MDVSMPKMNGIEATRRLRAALPEVCVIGLSVHEDVESARAMREAGAAAYVRKDAHMDGLLRTIRDVVAGQVSKQRHG